MIIRNIPNSVNENLKEIIEKIAYVINLEVTRLAPMNFGRFKVGNGAVKNDRKPVPPIWLSFESKQKGDVFLELAKKARLSVNQIGFKESKKKVFFMEDLTQKTSEIYAKARYLKSVENWAYLWIKDGKVLVRKVANGEMI